MPGYELYFDKVCEDYVTEGVTSFPLRSTGCLLDGSTLYYLTVSKNSVMDPATAKAVLRIPTEARHMSPLGDPQSSLTDGRNSFS
jgi:hypothetical protein